MNNNWMSFSSADRKYTVSLSIAAFQTMKSLALLSPKSETGGILIGNYNDKGSHAYITKTTSPPRDSRSSWSTFLRGKKGLKQLLAKEWNEGRYYLGEWHFHPAEGPRPSSQDINQINQIANAPEYKCPEPILVIISPKNPENFLISLTVSIKGSAQPLTQDHFSLGVQNNCMSDI